MRDFRKPARSSAPASRQSEIMETAHKVSVSIARTALDVISGNRWMTSEKGQQVYALAIMVMRLEADLGVVCESSYAEARIMTMASAAHQIVLHSREEVESGAAVICLHHEGILVDPMVEQTLLPAYALVATPV